MASDLRSDVTELKHLLSQSRRPHVQVFLSSQIGSLEKVMYWWWLCMRVCILCGMLLFFCRMHMWAYAHLFAHLRLPVSDAYVSVCFYVKCVFTLYVCIRFFAGVFVGLCLCVHLNVRVCVYIWLYSFVCSCSHFYVYAYARVCFCFYGFCWKFPQQNLGYVSLNHTLFIYLFYIYSFEI